MQELFNAQLSVDRTDSDFTAISLADATTDDVLSDSSTIALLAGVLLFLLGIAASVLWEQTFGLVRRPADIRSTSPSPVFTVPFRGALEEPEFLETNALVRRTARHQIPGSPWLFAPVGEHASLLAPALAHTVGDGGGNDATEAAADADQSDDGMTDDPSIHPPPGSVRLQTKIPERATTHATRRGSPRVPRRVRRNVGQRSRAGGRSKKRPRLEAARSAGRAHRRRPPGRSDRPARPRKQ